MAGLAGAGVALILGVAGWGRSRRTLRRRLTALALRMADDPGSVGSRMEGLFAHVERAVDAAMEKRHDADSSVARLAGALDAVPWAVVVCDEDGRATYRNRAADALVASRQADALVWRAVEEQLTMRAGTERVLQILGPPARVVSLRSAPIDDGRRVVGTVVVADDVTDRRRAEQVQRDFLSNASHELRSPIGALAVLAEMLTEEGSREVTRRLAGRLHNEAERANRIVDDLLALGHLGSGAETERREPVRVAHVVADALERVAPLAETRGVPVEVAAEATGATVSGDARQLGSAVFNLVENAVKYSPAGHAVRVEARDDEGLVEVVVSDEGVGIPADDVGRIFERFYRVGRAAPGAGGTDDPGGSGLGLSIARGVAEDHGGAVLVESLEGQGSTFILRLPRSDGASEHRCRIASTG